MFKVKGLTWCFIGIIIICVVTSGGVVLLLGQSLLHLLPHPDACGNAALWTTAKSDA